MVTIVQPSMDNKRSFSIIVLLVIFGLLLFSGHSYDALDIFMSNSSAHTLESAMIKACIGPDDEDPKGYDSVCFPFIPI